jgi:hypothetical protein
MIIILKYPPTIINIKFLIHLVLIKVSHYLMRVMKFNHLKFTLFLN